MADIVLINPRFEPSYCGLEHALPVLGARAVLPIACLPLLAALTPNGHRVTIIDENVEEIDFERCARADIVGVTGMIVQRTRMTAILSMLKQRGVLTVVGGPWISVQEDYFGALADVVFIGEAEDTWPRFLAEWAAGRHGRRYEQAEKTDMSSVPAPRFDLLRMGKYAFGSVQISRGCPFACEFCDIIVVFGRRPRIKTSAQVLAELDALLALGKRNVFIVDDNLIGNKKAIKPVLQDLVAWQQANGYPISFFTEASLDLADDAELMQLMVDANIDMVFVGIETPNDAALRETKKFQNVRAGGTMIEKVHRIQGAGMEVWSGMILGFDSDDAGIFEAQRRFVRDARIVHAMVGMLSAIPRTPLHDRLAAEGRLDRSDAPEFGTNVIPLRLDRAALRDGYLAVLNDLHEPEAYFGRLEALYLDGRLDLQRTRRRYLQDHPIKRFALGLRLLVEASAIFVRLMHHVPDAGLRREYRRRMWRAARRRREPLILQGYAIKCAMHYHVHTLVRQMLGGGRRITNSF
jgi:radical SAM superfamily enzyme YgiQ (UPF0313 family)